MGFSLNTIYQQVEDLSLVILTHEIVYAVIDHYFVKRSPPKIARMLYQLSFEQRPHPPLKEVELYGLASGII
jgi:hypothetical protein